MCTFGRYQPNFTREAVRLTVIERTLSGAKAKRVLGYRRKVTIDEGLTRAGKWFVEEEQRRGTKKTAQVNARAFDCIWPNQFLT